MADADAVLLRQVKLFVELFTSKFQGPFFKALRSENDEQLVEAAKALEYGLTVRRSLPCTTSPGLCMYTVNEP